MVEAVGLFFLRSTLLQTWDTSIHFLRCSHVVDCMYMMAVCINAESENGVNKYYHALSTLISLLTNFTSLLL